MNNGWIVFKEYAVKDVNSVEEFLEKYYKASRYKERGEEYAACILNRYKMDFEDDGYVFISRHESITGKVVSYYKEVK